jgi:hypothetical protein
VSVLLDASAGVLLDPYGVCDVTDMHRTRRRPPQCRLSLGSTGSPRAASARSRNQPACIKESSARRLGRLRARRRLWATARRAGAIGIPARRPPRRDRAADQPAAGVRDLRGKVVSNGSLLPSPALNRRGRGLRTAQLRGWPPSSCDAFNGPVAIAQCRTDHRRVASVSQPRLGDHSVIVYAAICYNAPCRTCRIRRQVPWALAVGQAPAGRIVATRSSNQ